MPDPRSLEVGDLVRFITIPDAWSEIGRCVPRDSLRFMKKMIRRTWPSRVCQRDSSGYPWIEARIRKRGKLHFHWWLITESTGWRPVRHRGPTKKDLVVPPSSG